METVEIHSKDYLVRWVHGDANTTVTWKVSPDKRSINFGVFVHDEEVAGGIQLSKSTGSVKEKLEKSGFRPLIPEGLIRVEGKETAEGSAFLDKSIMLAFVFDNTFSISNGKHVRFSFNASPEVTQAQPQLSAQLLSSSPTIQPESPLLKQQSLSNNASAENLVPVTSSDELTREKSGRKFPETYRRTPADLPPVTIPTGAPALAAAAAMKSSATSLTSTASTARNRNASISSRTDHTRPLRRNTTASLSTFPDDEDQYHGVTRVRTRQGTSLNTSDNELQRSADGRFVSGYLQKKRRKQFQGFARRYFMLDKSKGLLTYYLNSRTGSLRGVMPIKIVEITTDNRNLQLTLDSGMEKWTVKASDSNTYDAWYSEIKQLRSTNTQDEGEDEDEDEEDGNDMEMNANGDAAAAAAAALSSTRPPSPAGQKYHQNESSLPAPAHLKHFPSLHNLRDLILMLPAGSYRESLERNFRDLVKDTQRVHSTTEKTSNKSSRSDSGCSANSGNAIAYTYPDENTETTLDLIKRQISSNNFMIVSGIALISSVLVGFTFTLSFVILIVGSIAGGLVSFTEIRSIPHGSIYSSDSDTSSNFSSLPSPAQDYDNSESEYDASGSEDEETHNGAGNASIKKSQSNDSTTDTNVSYVPKNFDSVGSTTEEPSESAKNPAETSLYPLPHAPVNRRTNVTGPSQPPPSLMTLLKKAKQNSNMGAPITTNEPMSGVQTIAELFENSELLDQAAAAQPRSNQRVILVALFQVARIASMRVKERSMRKPFTPLLGETFEMVREDRGLRYVSEKVLHKPEVIATQTESTNWTVHFTSRPHTKMWAKSAQLTDVGTFCVAFPDGEKVSYINPEMFIRNILAGERYVEPSGTVIVESSAGTQATVEYKAGGMFSGRSEDVTITSGKLVYEGKWTESIRNGSEVVWKAKPTVADPTKHYGWTVFCAQLNETTPIEQGKIPPNDSRLRPDLKLYEDQSDLDKAESIKLELEQHQRERRSVMEREKKQHEPFFFKKSNDADGHYVLHKGKRNYWVMREQQNWNAIPHYFK